MRCSYAEFEAVRGVSLDVFPGELYALLGTNGAGKTTVVETLEGHRRPSAGHVEVLGRDPAGERHLIRREVGMMLQESGFAGELTALETIRMWAGLSTVPSDPGRALEAVDLTHRSRVRVQNLSGGERRRLDFALATLKAPRVLFLDEPTTGLDPESRVRMWELIDASVRAGTTVLLTTHYLEEAEALADRIAIMHEGRIVVSGDKQSLLSREPSVISFRTGPAGAERLPELPDLPGPPVRRPGGRVEIRSFRPQQDLASLLQWSREQGTELEGLDVRRASLEHLFKAVVRGERTDGATAPKETSR
nr:ABC transporter ATP-binding protein [Streptomyces harenosi]